MKNLCSELFMMSHTGLLLKMSYKAAKHKSGSKYSWISISMTAGIFPFSQYLIIYTQKRMNKRINNQQRKAGYEAKVLFIC